MKNPIHSVSRNIETDTYITKSRSHVWIKPTDPKRSLEEYDLGTFDWDDFSFEMKMSGVNLQKLKTYMKFRKPLGSEATIAICEIIRGEIILIADMPEGRRLWIKGKCGMSMDLYSLEITFQYGAAITLSSPI